MLPQIALDQNLRADRQVKNCIWNETDAVHAANPGRLDAPDDGSGHQRVDIPVRENDEPGSKRWNDPVFELVGKIRRIKQTESSRAQNVAVHGLFQFASHERGSFKSDIDGWMAAAFEPVSKKIDLCRTA